MAINPPAVHPNQIRSLLVTDNTSVDSGYWAETTNFPPPGFSWQTQGANKLAGLFFSCGAGGIPICGTTYGYNQWITLGLTSTAGTAAFKSIITPSTTGNVLVNFTSVITNTGPNDNLEYVAPIYGVGSSGAGFRTLMSLSNGQFIGGSTAPIRAVLGGGGTTSGTHVPPPSLSFMAVVQGLSLGVTYWFDVAVFLIKGSGTGQGLVSFEFTWYELIEI